MRIRGSQGDTLELARGAGRLSAGHAFAWSHGRADPFLVGRRPYDGLSGGIR